MQDEISDDIDPLPAWIRAKKAIAQNWELMEKLTGTRKDVLRNMREFSDLVKSPRKPLSSP